MCGAIAWFIVRKAANLPAARDFLFDLHSKHYVLTGQTRISDHQLYRFNIDQPGKLMVWLKMIFQTVYCPVGLLHHDGKQPFPERVSGMNRITAPPDETERSPEDLCYLNPRSMEG